MFNKPANKAWIDWFYNDYHGFGRALTGLDSAPKTVDTAFVTGKTTDFERLADLPELRRLSVREISQAQLELIATLTELSELRVYGFRGVDAGRLASLKKLQCLSFEWSPKIETIDWLVALEGLRVLIIGDLKRIEDFAPVGALSRLQFLYICGGNERAQAIASVVPLARLAKLEELQLIASVHADDLSPLASMIWLQRLGITNNYPVEAYAHLAARLPRTQCDSFAATQSYVMSGDRYVRLTGKPARQFKHGDPKSLAPIAKRETEFARWLAHYKENLGA